MIKHSNFEHDGQTFAIMINDKGEFTTRIANDEVKAETLEKIRQKIMRAARRKTIKLALPATVAKVRGRFSEDAARLIDIVITGIHQRNRNVLYRAVSDHKAGDVDYSDKLMKRLTPAEHAKYLALQKADRDATKAFNKFVEDHEYRTDDVRRAVTDAEKAAGLEPSEDE